ncbi:MAG: hypothetical protein RL736_777 [Pseudomonadota bacterium]
MSSSIKTVGFIGTGLMGLPMAKNILSKKFKLNVWNRTPGKTLELQKKGAKIFKDIKDLVQNSKVIVSMLANDDVCKAILIKKIHPYLKKGQIIIDMSSTTQNTALEIGKALKKKKAIFLDAPVSGGDVGARDAKLTIMVGGTQEVFDQALPVLRLMGTSIILQGGAGMGQHTKMCNQIVIASNIMGVAEGLAYAKKVGLDPSTVLQSIGGGAASGFQLNVLGTRMIAGDYAPGFYIEHFIKDLTIALAEAKKLDLDLPGLSQAKKLYDQMVAKGLGRDGTQGLLQLYIS